MVRAGVAISLVMDLDAPLPELIDRAKTAESLGFEAVYVPDHSRPWRHDPRPGGLWFDGWITLAAFAATTSTVRLGTLVSNPVLRPPGLLAREALAVDHLSAGRLQLGIGTGIAGFDHEAAGTPYWPLPERLARFREYVAFVDGALRSAGAEFSYEGEFIRGKAAGQPPPVQSPRPPITVAGASKAVRAVAVERAECWNTHGAFGVAPDDLPAHLAELNGDVTARCDAAGRDPASLVRSVLLFESLSPWSRRGRLPELVEQMTAIGYQELVVFWPWDAAAHRVFEEDATGLGGLTREA